MAQGNEVQQRIERQIAEAVASSFVISLGGENGEDWGQCLAVQVSFLQIRHSTSIHFALTLTAHYCDDSYSPAGVHSRTFAGLPPL